MEYGHVSLQDNFFWRHEDNLFYEQYLPPSIYTQDALANNPQGKIRDLFLESYNTAVFRNIKNSVKGPDAPFWNDIGIVPLPQVPNLVGKDWIFLNGPTFPRNERMIFVHGGARGTKVQKHLVLPENKAWPSLGIRSGSYPAKLDVNLGGTKTRVNLEAHQQTIISLQPQTWKVSRGRKSHEKDVYLVPLTLAIPHDDAWVTILTTELEEKYFTLFGGGQENPPVIPEPLSLAHEKFSPALSNLRYMDTTTSWDILADQVVPVWEVPLAAGHYRLTCTVEGLENESEIRIELEDAKGGTNNLPGKSFHIAKGVQQIVYPFTKPFVPYQGRFLVKGVSGGVRLLEFKLFPDNQRIAADFAQWRTSGIKPDWISRFGGQKE
jgi:hypothetical protein